MSSRGNIDEGMPVYLADGQPLGTVQGIRGTAIIVNQRPIPRDAIARVTDDGVYLQNDATLDGRQADALASRGPTIGDAATIVRQGDEVDTGGQAAAAGRDRVTFEESYRRSRPAFEQDFAARAAGATDAWGRGRTFALAEPNYRAGFTAGHDLHFEGRAFEEIEPELRREYEASIASGDPWERLREEIRTGFQAARDRAHHLDGDMRRTTMSESVNLDRIEPGMVVYGADGAEIGPVEAIHQASIHVASHEVPREAITRVDTEGVHLQVAKNAFMARRDMDVEAVSNPDMMARTPRGDDEVAGTPDFDRSRPHFEEHFRAQRPQGAPGGATFDARDFRDAEPHYRAGFAAGRDPRYAGRAFDDVAEELHPAPADRGTGAGDDAAWEALRQQLREGFEHARRGGA